MSAAMDEIAYWIHTKRAPCLMNYDNPVKKCDRQPRSITEENPSPKKKKKRKLSLLDDDSASTDHQQNVFFESSRKRPSAKVKCESSLGSDVDFNIKNTSVQEKRKRAKVQKNNRTLHKKNKVITSTPKNAAVPRRSLRHNKGVNHLNSSFDIFNSIMSNGVHTTNNVSPDKSTPKRLENPELLGAGDRTAESKRNSNLRNRSKHQTQNGQFDDVSDVSGFTANYIRSTKVQSNKSPRNLRCKPARNLAKESQQRTRAPPAPPGSTDSSLNLIDLVTPQNNHKSTKHDKSTSLLKFVDPKAKGRDDGKAGQSAKPPDTALTPQSSASRYPKRNKLPTATPVAAATRSADKRRKSNKNCIEFNNSDKKENPDDKVVSKTRSGRSIGLGPRENSVLVVSNSTEPVSSMVSLNVASPGGARRRASRRPPRAAPPPRASLRDRSGFAACFPESDDDSEPLIQRKFFCA